MKNLIYTLFPYLFLFPTFLNANESYSVEIEALTLVMEKYNNDIEKNKDIIIQRPNYMAFKQDECNAKVEVTEKTGLQITMMESFDVNVCKKEVSQTISN